MHHGVGVGVGCVYTKSTVHCAHLFQETWFPKWTHSHGTLQVTKIRQQPVRLQTSMSRGNTVVTRVDAQRCCGDAAMLLPRACLPHASRGCCLGLRCPSPRTTAADLPGPMLGILSLPGWAVCIAQSVSSSSLRQWSSSLYMDTEKREPRIEPMQACHAAVMHSQTPCFVGVKWHPKYHGFSGVNLHPINQYYINRGFGLPQDCECQDLDTGSPRDPYHLQVRIRGWLVTQCTSGG